MSEQEARAIVSTYGVYTSRLIHAMRDGIIGNELTDAELESIAGIPCAVKARGYTHLQSAIRAVEREGIVWRRIRKEHKIRCLGNIERIDVGEQLIRRARKSATRSARCLATVEISELSGEDKIRATGAMTQAGVIAQITRKDSQKRLGCATSPQGVDTKRLIEFIAGAK